MQIYTIINSRKINPKFKYLFKKGTTLFTSVTPIIAEADTFNGNWTFNFREFEKNSKIQLYVKRPKCYKTYKGYIKANFPDLFNYDVWKHQLEFAIHVLISYFSEIPITKLIEDMYWHDLAQLKDGRWLVVGAEEPFLGSSNFYIIEL